MNEDKSSRYQRLKRQVSVVSVVWTIVLFAGLLASGTSRTLRDTADRWVGAGAGPGHASAEVAVYVILLSLLNEVGGFPLALYSGFFLERRYGLSHERFARWLRDQAKSFAIGVVFACVGAVAVYALMRVYPARWWLAAGALFAAVVVALANVAPVVLLPMFYRVKPLDRESLRLRLLRLADRAGARVLGAYEWGLGEKTRKANAALTGLGGTRRILVSDTMLADYTEEEIEVVLAHELAHHVHGHIWKGIVFESGLILAGFYLASKVLATLAPTVGLRGIDDVAGLPLLVLGAGAVSFVMLPVAYAMSRAFERSADRLALDLTRNPAAFMSAMRRLAAQNLADERPSKVVEWLFYSHPPVAERIAAAQAFEIGH